jgi:hypothetical protein
MAAPQRLQAGSLQPSANPVSSFLNFDANSKPAAPAQPSKLGQISRVTGIQRGAMRDVQGVNPLQELSEALAPLTKVADAGMQLYATNEYKKGQNEILKAAANINRDQQQKSVAYAEQNRELDRQNPVAGILMDQANPFRQAGRVNQASKWVATQTPAMFKAEWARLGGDLRKLDPSDPRVMAVQARVTNQLTSSFGLDEFSPGFQDYVLPTLNKSWEWFQNEQYKGRVAYDKEVGARQTTDALVSLLLQPGGATPDSWADVLTNSAVRYGLSGEPEKMTREAIVAAAERLRLMQANPDTKQQATSALYYLNGMPSGLTDTEGNAISVGEAYGVDLLSGQADISRDLKTIRDNEKDLAIDVLGEDPSFESTIGMDPTSPGWQLTFEQLRAMPEYDALSDAELREALIDQSEQAEEWQGVTFDPQATSSFFMEQEEAFGSDWNEGDANKRFRQLIQGAPQQVRQDLQKRWRTLREDKRREQSGELDSSMMNEQVDLKVKALIQKEFPSKGVGIIRWMNENPGGDLIAYLGSVDAAAAERIAAAKGMYRRQGARAIRQETAANGGPLTPERQSEIWEETWKNNVNSYLPLPEAPAEEAKAEQQKVTEFYSPSQPVPPEAVRANVPVYKPTDVTEMLGAIANGSSLPTQVRRSAVAAGMTPGEFMLREAYLLGLEVPEPMRKKILQMSNRSMGLHESLISMAPPQGPLSQSTGVLLNILSGTAPSYSRPIAG